MEIKKPIDKIFDVHDGGATVLIVAKRFSGKTHLLRWIFYNLGKAKKFNYGILFSQTGKSNKQYDFMPENSIFVKFDESILENLYERQRELWEGGKKIYCFIILDDFIGDANLTSPIMQTIVSTGRWYGISLFICSQKFTQAVSPLIRDNTDYAIFFKNKNSKVIKLIWEEYASDFGDYKVFLHWFQKQVVQYSALLIDTKTQSGEFNDTFGLISAPKNIPPFKLNFKNHS